MRRRELFLFFGGAIVGWSQGARAQRRTGIRHIGFISGQAENDPDGQSRLAAFLKGMQGLGWTVGKTLDIDIRWSAGSAENTLKHVAELVALKPDVILSSGTPSVTALLQATKSIPIVFAQVIDPVGAGHVASLARPGGNATGFTPFEYGTSAKWLEFLKQIVPGMTRCAVIRDARVTTGTAQFAAIQGAASAKGVDLTPIGFRDVGEIERSVAAFARNSQTDGLIVTQSTLSIVHRELISKLAAQYRLPAIYAYRFYVTGGGLMSYGPDTLDPYRRAASYVDRILKGEKPADLPVQAPTKYELAINLKTAKALGLSVPQSIVATADEVIEQSAISKLALRVRPRRHALPFNSIGTIAASLELRSVSDVLTLRTCGAPVSFVDEGLEGLEVRRHAFQHEVDLARQHPAFAHQRLRAHEVLEGLEIGLGLAGQVHHGEDRRPRSRAASRRAARGSL